MGFAVCRQVHRRLFFVAARRAIQLLQSGEELRGQISATSCGPSLNRVCPTMPFLRR